MSNTDLSIQHLLASSDGKLKQIISVVSLPELESTQHVFHDLMSCVLEQQIHYRSTKKIFHRLLRKSEIDYLTPDNFGQLEEKALTSIKLSATKYETIVQVLDLFQEYKINWQELTDDEVRSRLVKIKGISNWTADMILLYTLGRADVFPADDYHLKEMMTKVYSIGPHSKTKAFMKAIAENWVPYRSTAVRYLLAWKAILKNK